MKQNKGFTLIELVVVIVILGILAAVAVPRFIDLSDQAADAALQGVVGSIESASAINYAASVAGSGDAITTAGENCADAVPNILQSGMPGGYTLTGTIPADSGDTGACTVTPDNPGNLASLDATVIAAD